MSHEPMQLLTEWAELLVDSFHAAGVRDVVISPGSRSTPFVLAAVGHEGLRCHDVIDERSAAFFALGQAKATGRPSLLICTSGSAGAHYLPAIVEAAQSYAPLLVLTADRPFELQGCHAAQTIDQTKLFGDHVRRFIELGQPDAAPSSLQGIRRAVAQAVHESQWPLPGPVHLNARARKPLEPIAARTDAEREASARARSLKSRPIARAFAPRSVPSQDALELLAETCAGAERGLIVRGPAPVSETDARARLVPLAARTGFPILADATSQLRFCEPAERSPLVLDAASHLLASKRFRAERPDVILQFGAAPTTGAWDTYLAEHRDVPRFVIAPHGWHDPQGTATAVIVGDVAETARALSDLLASVTVEQQRKAWARRLLRANDAAWSAVGSVIERANDLSEAEAVRVGVRHLPSAGALFVGNSLPIRMIDAVCPSAISNAAVISQRGANGIDGLVSGAAGVASTGRPTLLVLGDVSLAHDLGGLAVARQAKAPLVVLVLQNGGGRIFEQLPIARMPGVESAMPHFTTPPEVSFRHAAEAYGLAYAHADSRGTLTDALKQGFSRNGCTLVEAQVPPHGAVEMFAAFAREVDAAVERAWSEPRG